MCIYLYYLYFLRHGYKFYAPCSMLCCCCVLVLYQMRSYLLLISFADTDREIVSRWGRWIQVLERWIPWIHYIIVMFENNKLCLQNVLLKIILQYVPEGSGSWKYIMYYPVDEVARKIVNITNCELKWQTQKQIQASMCCTLGRVIQPNSLLQFGPKEWLRLYMWNHGAFSLLPYALCYMLPVMFFF